MTIDEIILLREDAISMKLIGSDQLASFTPEELQKVCNGIGAEFLPEQLRVAMDTLHPSMKASAMIHDLDYYLGNNSYEDFTFANDKLCLNGRITARFKYKWFDPRRYIVYKQAKIFAEICQSLGWFAYLQAIKDREKEGCK